MDIYMFNVLSVFSIFQSISVISCFFILIYMLTKGEKTLKLLSFEFVIVCLFIWSAGQLMEYSAKDLILLSYYTKIIHTAISFIGVSTFIFSLYYTENLLAYKYKKYLLLFFIFPVFVFIVIMTNDFHGLYYTIFKAPHSMMNRIIRLGPFFWAIYSYNIALIFISIGVVIKSAVQNTGKIRKQMILIVLVMLTPITVNVIEILISFIIKWNEYPIDFTPTTFSFSCLFAFLAALRYNFLDIMPIALKIVFDRIEHATVVFNQNGKLVKYNPSFDKIFNDYLDYESGIDSYQKLCNVLRQSSVGEWNAGVHIDALSETIEDFRDEIILKSEKSGETRVYEIHIQSIFNSPKHFLGIIITFHDITRHKTLVEELNQKNSQLTDMNEQLLSLNKQLNENIKLTEKLAVMDERNRISRELHDSLGHTLMLVIMLMKATKIEYDSDSSSAKEKLNEAIHIAEDGFREIKRLINGLLSDDIKNRNIIYNLENLFNDVRTLGVKINFSVIGEEYFNQMVESETNFKIIDTLYKICKEALTNSIRHGKSTSVNVILKYTSESINIYILDNGTGCKEIKEGLGLIGM
ncbi:MAG TPA: histidine kinase N-terminal 7TM domain-containing protein [Clostridia bacterium]